MIASPSLTTRHDPREPTEPGAGGFVVSIWVGLVAAALGFVARYGPAFPRWDDFAVVGVLTGTRRLTPGWLWSQHNEHRVPLPRGVLLALLRLSGGDFRAGMVFNVAVLAVLAILTALVARRCRGAWRSTDAFFPLVLLNLGHQANLLWAWQVQFVLSTVRAGGLLLLIVTLRDWPGPWRSAALGFLLALLPLCGANGVALVPALALWLTAAAAFQLRRDRPRGLRAGLWNGLAAAVALAVVVLYFRDYHAVARHAARPGLAETLATALQFLCLTFGPSAARGWPYAGVLFAGLLAASVGLLIRVAVVRLAERPRASGLLSFLGALGSLAIGLGWGRAGASGLGGFEPRYVTLAAPLGCALSIVRDLYGPNSALRRLVPLSLFATALVLLWPNTEVGLVAGRDLAGKAGRFERDVRSGEPMFLVIQGATPLLHPSQDALSADLPALRRAGIGVFRALRPDPAFREVAVPLVPTETRMAVWDRGAAHVNGVDPRLTFALPAEGYVAGVRLRYGHANPEGGPARFKISWRRRGQPDDPPGQSYGNWGLPTGSGRETTVWVGDRIDEIRIQPDNRPCDFRIDAITLLVPVD